MSLWSSGTGRSSTERRLALRSRGALGPRGPVRAASALHAHARHRGIAGLSLQTGLASGALGTGAAGRPARAVAAVEAVGPGRAGRARASAHAALALAAARPLRAGRTDDAGKLGLGFQLHVVAICARAALEDVDFSCPKTSQF